MSELLQRLLREGQIRHGRHLDENLFIQFGAEPNDDPMDQKVSWVPDQSLARFFVNSIRHNLRWIRATQTNADPEIELQERLAHVIEPGTLEWAEVLRATREYAEQCVSREAEPLPNRVGDKIQISYVGGSVLGTLKYEGNLFGPFIVEVAEPMLKAGDRGPILMEMVDEGGEGKLLRIHVGEHELVSTEDAFPNSEWSMAEIGGPLTMKVGFED